MLLNQEQVLKVLPHRDPFLFVDTVEKIDFPADCDLTKVKSSKDLVGTTVTAHYEVTEKMQLLKGHFPGNPMVPGVIQIEMMAQTGAFVSLGLNNMSADGIDVKTILLGVDKCRFRHPIDIGMKLIMKSTIDKCRGPIAYYSGELWSDSKLLSEITFLAKITVNKK